MKFKIVKQDGQAKKAVEFEEVDGEIIMIDDLECFVFEEQDEDYEGGTLDGFNVSHLETGMMMACSLVKDWAIKTATERYRKNPEMVAKAKEILTGFGVSFPVNPSTIAAPIGIQ